MTDKIYQCPDCGYQFNERVGDEHEGYPPGTPFTGLPDDFVCPDCVVCTKTDFICLADNVGLPTEN